MNHKFLITENEFYNPEAINLFETIGTIYYLDNYKAHEITVLVVRLSIKLDQKFLKNLINLKYILSPTTGLNHIDSTYCEKNNIEILSLKGEFNFLEQINATPEFTFSLLVTMTKNIFSAGLDVRNYGVPNLDRLNYVSKEFNELKIGIAGFGRVGKKLYNYCKNFNMEILVFDPYKDDQLFITDNINIIKDIKSFLSSIDVLIICISYSKENEKYFSKEYLRMLKQDAILINTSRGEVLDEFELIELLDKGKIKSAALDVLSIENTNNKELQNKIMNYAKSNTNLLLTPHIAGASSYSMNLTEKFIADKFINKLKVKI
jgi:D-3-phosphoglycerate dehydrogenase